jgi:hypothetical protein
MFPGYGMGLGELIIICLMGLVIVGLPIAVVALLVLIYRKLESIEILMKNKLFSVDPS